MRAAIYFGAEQAVSGWTGGVSVTTVAGPYAGTTAYRMATASVGVANAFRDLAFTARQSGSAIITLAVRAPEGTQVPRVHVAESLSGGVVAGAQIGNGAGSSVAVTPFGGTGSARVLGQHFNALTGWTVIALSIAGLVAGTVYRLVLLPSGATPSTGDAALTVWIRPVIVEGWGFDERIVEDVLRDGSEHVQSESGIEDAWITGEDSILRCVVRWMALADDGQGPGVVGVDGVIPGFSFRDFLSFGRAKGVCHIVPDLTKSLSIPAYLVEPMADAFEREDDGTHRCAVRLRSPQRIPSF